MLVDNAPSQLISLAAAVALVGAGMLLFFAALRRHRRNKKARAAKHARELVRKAKRAIRSNSPDQALQVPILVRLVRRIAEREGLQLHETGACQHSLQALMSEARRILREAKDRAERESMCLPRLAPPAAPAATAGVQAPDVPAADTLAGPVVMPDGLTHIYTLGDIEIIFVVEPPVAADQRAAAAAPFEIERFHDTRTGPGKDRVPPARNALGHEAGNLPDPDQVDALFDHLIIRKND